MDMQQEAQVAKEKKTHDHFMKCYGSAKGIAKQWESLLEACFYYAIPFRNRFYKPSGEVGEQKNRRLYDTTAVEATKTFVSKLHTSMTPPQVQWGHLEITDEYDDDDKANQEVKAQAQLVLDLYMKKLFQYIHISNFDVIINECYFDLAIGTACMVVNQNTDREPLMFTSIPLDKLAIKESLRGRIDIWYREWENIKISEIKLKWKNAKLTRDMAQMVASNPEATIKKLTEGVLYLPGEAKPYCYAVSTGTEFLFHEYLESNPGIIWRFQKTNAETWGRGPVMDALPTMASLNEMARIEFASANLNTFRPYMGFSDAIFNPHTFKLEPFSIIPIAPFGAGGQPPLIPLPNSASPEFGQMLINDLRMQIKTLLFNDTPSTASIQPGSVGEAEMNREDLAQKIGPLFSRLQQEFLWPLVERCMYVLDDMGILPKPKVDGKDIKFAYRSPLAASRGMMEVAKFTQWMQISQGVYGPEVPKLYIDPMKTLYKLAEYMQLDPSLLNSPKVVEANMAKLQTAMEDAKAQGQEPQPQQPAQMQQ